MKLGANKLTYRRWTPATPKALQVRYQPLGDRGGGVVVCVSGILIHSVNTAQTLFQTCFL